MDSLFDFRIKQSVCVQTLESYSKMQSLLKAEMENQQQNTVVMGQSWSGKSAGSYVDATGFFFREGSYNRAYRQVKGMREALSEALPEINALLARCEGFLDQLQSDTYVEPVIPVKGDNTSRNGDILSLNYGVIGVVKDLCDAIEEENNSLTAVLKKIISNCGDLLEGTADDLSAVETASKKLNRVANYKDSFQIYETGIRGLEFDLNLQFCTLAENVEELCEAVGISEAELESEVMDLEDVYNPLYMSQQDLQVLMNQYLNQGNITGMQLVAEQIFAQNTGEWNDAETLFIAETLNYAFEHEHLEMIEMYTGHMFTAEYSKPEISYVDSTSNIMLYSSEYEAKPDTTKIEMIMAQMDPESQGKAYYSLNRISKLQFEPVKMLLSDAEIVECGKCLVNAELVEGRIQMTFTAQIPGEYGRLLSSKEAQCAFTVSDMRKVITSEDAKRLAEIGFTENQVEEMRLSAVTDMDIVFLDKLADRNYVEAFDVPHWFISDETGAFLAEYTMILERNRQTQELQTMVNKILETSPENNICIADTRGNYLQMIQDHLLLDIYEKNSEVLLLESGSIEEKELIDDARKAYKQYGLWSAVNNIYYLELGYDNLDWYEHSYANGYCHAVISELDDGIGGEDSMYSFRFDLVMSEDGANFLDGFYGTVDMGVVSANNYATSIQLIDLNKLKEERDQVPINTVVKGITMLTDKVLPGSSYIIPLIKAIEDGGFRDVAEAQVGFPYEEYIASCDPTEGQKLTRSEFDSILSAYFQYQELNQKIDEKLTMLQNIQLTQAIWMEYKLYDEEENLVANAEMLEGGGVMLPQAMKNLTRWEEEGISVFLRESGISYADIKEVVPKIEQKNKGQEGWDSLIYGGDISAIPQDDLSKYILSIQSYLETHCPDDYDISKWLREGK